MHYFEEFEVIKYTCNAIAAIEINKSLIISKVCLLILIKI